MHGIYGAAIFTTILALAIIGVSLLRRAPREERPYLLAMVAVHVPMCMLAYQVVRVPLMAFVQGLDLPWKPVVALLYAPLTEEPAKLWLLLVPTFYATLGRENAWRRAMAIGLGFGIGEAWTVAYWIASSGRYAELAWYQFGGFIGERFMVCVIHGLLTAAALRFARRRLALGVALAMMLHFLCNAPIMLAATDVGGLGKAAWQVILTLYVPVFLVALALIDCRLFGMSFGWFWQVISGRARCPDCGHEYVRPLLGANFGDLRFEPCPACHRWHWTHSLPEPERGA